MATTTSSQKDTTQTETIKRLDSNRGVFANFIARIPKRLITGLGKILGFFLYYFDLPHRRIVQRNLLFVYPDWSRNHIQKFAKRIFQHFGMTILEFLLVLYFICGIWLSFYLGDLGLFPFLSNRAPEESLPQHKV